MFLFSFFLFVFQTATNTKPVAAAEHVAVAAAAAVAVVAAMAAYDDVPPFAQHLLPKTRSLLPTLQNGKCPALKKYIIFNKERTFGVRQKSEGQEFSKNLSENYISRAVEP